MGQKIHPLGFRVGITKKHQSQWFARFHKHQYAQTVLEDHFLRKTIHKLLPELLEKKSQPKAEQKMPKISHIKIERGLIPYEIGIQIYAQDCEFIKSAVDKLEINPSNVHNLLKYKYVLEKAGSRLSNQISSNTSSLVQKQDKTQKTSSSIQNKQKKQSLSNTKLSLLRREKRLRKRTTILERFRERFLENMIIVKKGQKITRKFKKPDVFNPTSKTSLNTSFSQKNSKNVANFSRRGKATSFQTKSKTGKNTALGINSSGESNTLSLTVNPNQSQKMKKFVNVFAVKMKNQFLSLLKVEMKEWNSFMVTYKQEQLQKYGVLRYAPVGYEKKWSLARLKRIQNKPLPLLMKLAKSLQKRALLQLEILRKEFLVLGIVSKTKSFSYFQRIRFIKALRQLIQKVKMEQKVLNVQTQLSQKQSEKSLLALTDKAYRKKLNNLVDETRKIKFIDYLQDVVKKHRHRNIALYLATISDSRHYLRKIQKFTKQQANFLFGINAQTLRQLSNTSGPVDQEQLHLVKNEVTKALQRVNRKNDLEKTLQDVFLEQLQKQKTVSKQNIECTPKISVKFYSIKPQNLETKASFVADSIVDDLEKRKAFRRVIKKAKEDLMKTSKVKGVKIQVSGRLNGAEIARSEWVRAGRVPLQTLRANIDYCYKTAQTIYGIIGVKVWIYKGYTKMLK
uniref:Small ribosomal subunit protein uS3c n=1 Tax=Pseudomuriella schumacherensis TaxID=889459 RepID=A0A140HB30_PSESB|nr:ribosomal protein S3 [Pseudomuriella schumacherensis]AMO01379.1 ribosomal protein S3 [Pseudomuriella schumacherensis]